MADMIDVGETLVQVLAAVVYPGGTDQPSIVNIPIAVYQGWPNPANLDQDMVGENKRIHLTVWPTPVERVTESFASSLAPAQIAAATISVEVDGNTITIEGYATAGQNVAVLVDGAPFTHTVQAGDSLTSIATGLATAINASEPATNTGPIITVPGARTISATAGGTASMVQLLERVERVFTTTVWAPTPASRDALAKAIDSALRGTTRMAMADGTAATLRYRSGGPLYDNMQKSRVWRRDINYAIEFLITGTATATEVVTTRLDVAIGVANADGSETNIATKTIYS